MSCCGVVPTTRATGGGGGGWSRPTPCRAGRRAGVCCSFSSSSSFRAQEEGTRLVGSFYKLLGIPETGSLDEIKRAYKQMALKYHPDVSPPERAEEHTQRFIEVREAYETLSDPERRTIYDQDLARGLRLGLAFSSRRIFDKDAQRSRWKDCWQDQLEGLKRKSKNKSSEDNLSWAAQMRMQREAE